MLNVKYQRHDLGRLHSEQRVEVKVDSLMWTWSAPRRASAAAEVDVSRPSLPGFITTIQNKTKKNRAKRETFHIKRNEPRIMRRRTEDITKNPRIIGKEFAGDVRLGGYICGWGADDFAPRRPHGL